MPVKGKPKLARDQTARKGSPDHHSPQDVLTPLASGELPLEFSRAMNRQLANKFWRGTQEIAITLGQDLGRQK